MTCKCIQCGAIWRELESHDCPALRGIMLDRLDESIRHASVGNLIVIVDYDPDPDPNETGDVYEFIVYDQNGRIMDSCSGYSEGPDACLADGIKLAQKELYKVLIWTDPINGDERIDCFTKSGDPVFLDMGLPEDVHGEYSDWAHCNDVPVPDNFQQIIQTLVENYIHGVIRYDN